MIRNPLLSTVVGSLFAQRSIVLIGYSLSDPDLRQLLALIRERLGGGARAIYSLEVAPSAAKVSRFSRRHVRAVSLPGDPHNPAPTLEALFREVFDGLGLSAQDRLIPKTHESGLALRAHRSARGCFLSAPVRSQADYYEWFGPIAADAGAPLLSFQDFVAPGESILSAVDTMLAASGCPVIEETSSWTSTELGMALARLGPQRIFLITNELSTYDLKTITAFTRPSTVEGWESLADQFQRWLLTVLGPTQATLPQDNDRDALTGRIIRLSSDLENILSRRLENGTKSPRSLGQLVLAAQKTGIIFGVDSSILREFVDLRNRVAHGQNETLSSAQVESLLHQIESYIVALRG